ncbi:hypothetical protein B0919_05930 [Hymenobacter sp. CRA2]|nr:hypothetical protein B0919_05930 [Hymenobacter sp. CRA2]
MRAGLLLLLLFAGSWWNALQRVHDANAAQRLGAAAYARRDFAAAAQAYSRAQQLGNNSAELLLNLGHASARAGQVAEARRAYGQVLRSTSRPFRSVARQQLATLAATQGNYTQALALLRLALLDDPGNASARYNYELLRPYQGRTTPPPLAPPPPAPKPESTGTGKEQKKPADNGVSQAAAPAPGQGASGGKSTPGGTGKPQPTAQGNTGGNTHGLDAQASGSVGNGTASSGQGATAADNRLNTRQTQAPSNLTEAQARQVLEALQSAEQQYLQQLPHRATRSNASRKPTW